MRPPAAWSRLLDREFVVASTNVLDEGMTGDHDPGTAVLFEPSHRPQPCLEPTVIGFDGVVGVLVGTVPGPWQQVVQHHRVGRRPIGDDLDRLHPRRVDGPPEELAGRVGVPPFGHKHVDDLP
jgi:hypothetical protein